MTIVVGVLSVATLLVSIATLVATAMDEPRSPRRLAWARHACAGTAALLVAGSVPGLVSGLPVAVACIAALVSVHAIWLAMRRPAPLESSLDRLAAGGDAAWRAEFEEPFEEYVRERAPYS